MKSVADYRSKASVWERLASVRSRPRRALPKGDDGYFFPIVRQPICLHDRVRELGDEATRFILQQSLYKFLNDIALIETECVSRVATKLVNHRLPLELPDTLRLDLQSVVVDEAYHAYVALDFYAQVAATSGIAQVPLPPEIEIQRALAQVRRTLSPSDYAIFEVVAVCLAENTLTAELVSIDSAGGTHPTFQTINADHMADEGRHCHIFATVLELVWGQLEAQTQLTVGAALPVFIREYLSNGLQREFDGSVLTELGLDATTVRTVLDDVHVDKTQYFDPGRNRLVNNIMGLLNRCGVLKREEVRSVFEAAGYVHTGEPPAGG